MSWKLFAGAAFALIAGASFAAGKGGAVGADGGPTKAELLAFANQTKDHRAKLPPAAEDRFCNPYATKPARIMAVCEVIEIERKPDPMNVNIDGLALRSLWQVADALDMKAISDARAKAEIEQIVDRRTQALKVAAASKFGGGFAPSATMADSAPSTWAPTPETSQKPVTTTCNRLPYSITNQVTCVTE